MYKDTLKNPNNTKLLAEYRRYKNKLTQLTKIARNNKMEIDKNINYSKNLWNTNYAIKIINLKRQ